ncbi:MAG: 23S rRNA (adenine(2503)-C(2))-methyltransferase RlmN [Holosporaceae bacterium]|jgi:23S rRNA (adenine2503-C2)-methyltransferase|nr:23S rRNA (adenine(2503)-C(2))-methyltransferase RlmN [Holosporaceae bacterium]
MQSKINLLGLPLEQLKLKFLEIGLCALDAKRVFPWIHVKSARSFDVMSDLPQKIRKILGEKCSIDRPERVVLQKSLDGTQKALLKFEDCNHIETVLIPEENRNTICISSQIGCAIGCKFCYTGTQNFIRNLSSSEIMSQIFFWKDSLEGSITNIVFMGMGEPLLNYENLSNALELLLNNKAHNFSKNKITVSTSGIIGESFNDFAKFGVKLAISLHASSDEKRSLMMPINKKYDIETILKAAKKYLKNSNTDYITFEYLLLKNINDSSIDAQNLAKILHKIPCKVNLILFNKWPGSIFQESSMEKANKFSHILLSRGIRTIIRKSRGNDILAACGQLKSYA